MPKLIEGPARDAALAKLSASKVAHAAWRAAQNERIDADGIDPSARFDQGDATDAASVRAQSDRDRAEQRIVDITVKAEMAREKESGFPDGSWRDANGTLHIPGPPRDEKGKLLVSDVPNGFNVRTGHRKPVKRKGRDSTIASAPTGPEVVIHSDQTEWTRFRIDYGALVQAIGDNRIDPRDYGDTRQKLRQMGTTFLNRGFPFEAAICERLHETIKKRQYR